MYVSGSGQRGCSGGGEWMRGLGFGITNPFGTGEVLDVCLCLGCGGCGKCSWGVCRGIGPGSGGLG